MKPQNSEMQLDGSHVSIRVPATPTELPRGKETVLLADDNPSVRELVKIILTRSGYQVIEAVDGLDALEKFKEGQDRIELVILDGIMPRMSGIEAFREIRAIRPKAKVLFLTGYLGEDGAHETLQNEGVTVLSKPVGAGPLLRKIREVLDQKI